MINLKTIYGFNSFINCSDSLLNIDLRFSVDNRRLNEDNIYIAIVGEKYNPLNDIQKILDSGCRFMVYQASPENDKLVAPYSKMLVLIKVENIFSFIEQAGKAVANSFRTRGGKIIAISGSNGKTTTKEMLFHLFNSKLAANEVICTQHNNNNNLGVPFTLFQVSKRTKVAIVELGSNHPGEIELLARMLYPQFAVTTNIGDTHLEFFKDKECVLDEELKVADFTTKNFYLNLDDSLLEKRKKNLMNVKTFGYKGKDFLFTKEAQGVGVNGVVLTNSEITGSHNFFNLAVATVLAADILNLEIDSFCEAAKSFIPTKNRSEWLDYKGQRVFLDAYNANPSSMIAAISGFAEHLGSIGAKVEDACLIVGDMNELGDDASRYHEELAQEMEQFGFGMIHFVGRFAVDYAKGYKGSCEKFEDADALKKEYLGHIARYKYVFIKGSRSLQLETILDIR